jgi:hypothetical protein
LVNVVIARDLPALQLAGAGWMKRSGMTVAICLLHLNAGALTKRKVPCNNRERVFSGEDMECINPVKSVFYFSGEMPEIIYTSTNFL